MKLGWLSLKSGFEKNERAIVIATGAALLTAFLMNLEFNWIESSLYDLRMRMRRNHESHSNIVLIAIDDHTLTKLDEVSPLPLDPHVRLLEMVEKMRPRSIGYLVDMNRVAQAYPEQISGELGSRFVGVASRLEMQGVPFLLGTPFDINGEVIPPFPLSAVPHAVSVIHKDGNVFGEDKITRRALLTLYGKPSFHLELAHRLNGHRSENGIRGQFTDPAIEASYFFFNYQGPTGYGPKAGTKSDYKTFSMIDVLEGRVARRELEGKNVLVGSVSRTDSEDYAFTPYSKRAFANPKLIVHANILEAVLGNDGIVRSPDWLNWLTTFLLVGFVIWSVFTYTPLYGVFNTLLLASGFLVVGQILFSVRALWIREAQPLVGIFLSYYLAVPYRLIQEYKRRWDYQQKNEILMQVEELKTNFLRLVTHDLKTPVARIQGLAEMVLRKSSSRLDSLEKENLQHIMNSTDELNHFISSVLELTKVESSQTTLNLESKDVNQVLERVVERFDAQSRSSGVKIRMNLEPLFPIRIDVSLIAKVLTNIIDNAIKYSPAGSEILIQTVDLGDTVEISVKDEGIGLSPEELKNLFTRFYRAQNDQTTKTAGSGLGLYLTKFFVEAHLGRVEVVSEQNVGSLFKIILPVALKAEDVIKPGLKTQSPASKGEAHVPRTRSR
ncbi:MAG: CHASE2 domain-containing protein [Cryobacterium sp.]|nr:CHASE2 domain-containing protein [Oligoflexia bacterium]